MNHTWFMVSATECTASPNIALQGAKGQCMNCQVTGSHLSFWKCKAAKKLQRCSYLLPVSQHVAALQKKMTMLAVMAVQGTTSSAAGRQHSSCGDKELASHLLLQSSAPADMPASPCSLPMVMEAAAKWGLPRQPWQKGVVRQGCRTPWRTRCSATKVSRKGNTAVVSARTRCRSVNLRSCAVGVARY